MFQVRSQGANCLKDKQDNAIFMFLTQAKMSYSPFISSERKDCIDIYCKNDNYQVKLGVSEGLVNYQTKWPLLK